MSPTDSVLFVVFLSLAASATAQVARNVRIEGQQFVESKTNEVSRHTLGPSNITYKE